jgi:hypothetical protein
MLTGRSGAAVPTVSIMTLAGTATPADLRDLGVSGLRVAPRDLIADDRVSDSGVTKFRADWAAFAEAGFRLHAVTPFPGDVKGLAPTAPEWVEAWRSIGRELGEALGDLVATWQLGNELNLWHFREPLQTTAELAAFVEAVGGGLRDTDRGVALGINAFGVEEDALVLYRTFYGRDAPISLDFAGVDAYWGSWQRGGPGEWPATIDVVSEATHGVPVAVCEIGFPSAGGVWDEGELDRYLASLGYRSADEVERDRGRLLAAAPPSLAAILATLPTESWASDFEDHACHLLQKWHHLWGDQPATPDRQAAYFAEAVPRLLADDRLSEIMLFMYQDPPICWTCMQETCPLETSWGFVDAAGRRKPVFETVSRLLA